MDRALPIDRQIAKWSAVSVVFIAVTYVLTGVVWMVSGGLSAPAPLEPAQPFLSILEFLIILTAPPLVILVAGLHRCAAEEQKTRTLAPLGFMIAFATLTTAVHFAQLAVMRQAPAERLGDLKVLQLYPWPSVSLALDFLAWDAFLGLALLLAATSFQGGDKTAATVRKSMLLTGGLCLTGFLGPILGVLQLQFIAITGYAFSLPVTCVLIAKHFHRLRSSQQE